MIPRRTKLIKILLKTPIGIQIPKIMPKFEDEDKFPPTTVTLL